MQLLNHFKAALPWGGTLNACIRGDPVVAAMRLMEDDPLWGAPGSLLCIQISYDETKSRLKIGRKIHFWTE